MNVTRDFRRGSPDITITMSLTEFRDHVEWLEAADPEDGCTRDMRGWLDYVDPPSPPETCPVCGTPPGGRCDPPVDYEGDCPHGCSPEP